MGDDPFFLSLSEIYFLKQTKNSGLNFNTNTINNNKVAPHNDTNNNSINFNTNLETNIINSK